MRLARLLLVFAFLTISCGIAAGQESKAETQNPNAQPELQNPQTQQHQAIPGSRVVHRFTITPEDTMATNGCYVMHTIQVARDAKDSDSTHIVRVTNCTPAKRCEMKSAVATVPQR
jgi:hypothetical protein